MGGWLRCVEGLPLRAGWFFLVAFITTGIRPRTRLAPGRIFSRADFCKTSRGRVLSSEGQTATGFELRKPGQNYLAASYAASEGKPASQAIKKKKKKKGGICDRGVGPLLVLTFARPLSVGKKADQGKVISTNVRPQSPDHARRGRRPPMPESGRAGPVAHPGGRVARGALGTGPRAPDENTTLEVSRPQHEIQGHLDRTSVSMYFFTR